MTASELARRFNARASGAGWIARCPAHSDGTPSLSIRQGNSGVLLKCFAGCELREIVQALQLKIRDLFNEMTEEQFMALARGELNAKENLSAAKSSLATHGGGEPKDGLNGAIVQPDNAPPAQLSPLSAKQAKGIAEWRGYSQELVDWLNTSGLIGQHDGLVSFPVENGLHYRMKDGSWRYTTGAKPTLFVLGGIEEGAHVHCFESQWDALAFADASGDSANIVATRGAGSGTTGAVALELGRNAILIELNPKYVELIEQRCNTTLGLALA